MADSDLEELKPETPEQLRLSDQLLDAKQKVAAIRKWRGVTHSMIIWLRLYHFHSSQVRQILRFFSDADLLADVIEEDSVENLLFSVQKFRPNKQVRVNPRTLEIMRQNPAERLPADVRPIESGLRGYAAFRQYPPHLLRKIAEKAWYQEFDKHSVIVREGDYPLYYYFVIHGSALVTIIDQEKMLARTVAILNRGDSFGELAIANRSKRASTVIARERIGLMMLEDKDYLEIFMQGGVKFLDNSFVRNHVLFDEFDLEVLKANPDHVKLNFFNSGAVIVEDSRISYWVFLVIAGKATVKMAVHKSVLEHQDTELIPQQQKQQQQLLQQHRSGRISHETLLRRSWRRHLSQQEKLAMNPVFQANIELRQLQIQTNLPHQRQLSLVGRDDTVLGRSGSLPALAKAYFTAPNPDADNADKAEAEKQQQQQQPEVRYVIGKDAVDGKRTLATDLNREYFEQLQMKLWMGEFESESEFEFMPVQVLQKGMVFGFADHFFENQPHTKLISQGCELLCVRRETYFEHASELTLFKLGNTLRPFPTEQAVLSKNKAVSSWNSSKEQLYNKTLTKLRTTHVDVHDARSRLPAV